MTDSRCHQLDLYLDGDLPEADATAFESHAAVCADCTADLAASRLLNAEWARLATVACPPDLVETALRTARGGAEDRPPLALRRRYGRLAGVVTLGLLLIVLAGTVIWMQGETEAIAPLQASADAPAALEDTTAPRRAVDEPVETDTRRPETAPPAPLTSSTPPTPPPRQRPTPPPAPIEASPERLVAQTQPSPDSIAQAQADLMLALTLVADAQTRAGAAVSSEIGRAANALTDTNVF